MDRGAMLETPKAGDVCFERAKLSVGTRNARTVPRGAPHRGIRRLPGVLRQFHRRLAARKAADFLLAQLDELREANPRHPVALIADWGIEFRSDWRGLGGRNSALVLACVEKIAGKGITVLSAGTDGIDGNSPAAGAVATEKHLPGRKRQE